MPRTPHSPPPPPAWEKTTTLSTSMQAAAILAITIVLLVPCFWQPRIQAGDLASHLYNAWLTNQVERGDLSGLLVQRSWTNTLSDVLLSSLIGPLGVSATERIVVSFAVLLFFWGAFFLLRSIAGHSPWHFVPCLAMLTYGLIFHIGFLNFYLSTGFCLWSLALFWNAKLSNVKGARVFVAILLAALAVTAHLLPVLWAASVWGYRTFSRSCKTWLRLALFPLCAVGLGIMQWLLMTWFPTRWSMETLVGYGGLLGLSGAGQVWLYGSKYLWIALGLLVFWGGLLLKRLDQPGFFANPFVQLWALHMIAFVLLPSAILLPQYQHPLAYIPQRISLFAALVVCAIVAETEAGPALRYLSSMLAILYFGFLFIDVRANNAFEAKIADLVNHLPPMQRVVASIEEGDRHVPSVQHALDRACIGKCLSYGNYQPATLQFPLRVTAANPYVAASMIVVKEIEDGTHIVTAQEAPLYALTQSGSDPEKLCFQLLAAGDRLPKVFVRLPESASSTAKNELARGDQRQVPDHQCRVPVVDPADHTQAVAPNTNAAQR